MDGQEHVNTAAGYSRRAVLKRGAAVGAAAVWAVPVVQAISMTAASAENPSAPMPPSTPVPPTEQGTPPTAPTSGGGTTEASGDRLAYTGSDVLPIATAGAGFLAAGTAITVAARRRAGAGGTGEPVADTPGEGGAPPA